MTSPLRIIQCLRLFLLLASLYCAIRFLNALCRSIDRRPSAIRRRADRFLYEQKTAPSVTDGFGQEGGAQTLIRTRSQRCAQVPRRRTDQGPDHNFSGF